MKRILAYALAFSFAAALPAKAAEPVAKKKAAPAKKATPADDDDLAPAPLTLVPPPPPAPAKKKAPAAAPAVPAPVPLVAPSPAAAATPLPPPPAATVPSPVKVHVNGDTYRVIEAQTDHPAPDAGGGVTAHADTAPAALKRLRATPRVGLIIPRTELSVGPLAGAEVSYLLPVLDDRLRASFGAAYSLLTFKGPRVVPGRGFDPALIQNSTLVPLELLATYDLLKAESGIGLSAGLGYGLYITSSDVQAFSKVDTERSVASAIVFAARALKPVGPGAVLLDVRHAELKADLGPWASVAQGTFSGTSLALGYALDF